ncbi:MAG: Crp/Fnr family transcriptional regulator [Cocleimonas sp.]|nr:Crp/Fnr family transcriptional regulator [Cocleimonas sp.]
MQLTTSQHDLLRHTFLFVDFPEQSFQKIANHLSVSTFKTGERLFEQGQPIADFFFLVQGQVKLTRLSSNGNEKVIEIINKGESFAEAAVFGQFSGYPVNCFALQNSVVFKISAIHYRQELRASIDSCFAVMTRLSQRTHHLLNEIDRLTLHNAMHRLAVYLLTGVEAESGLVNVSLVAPKHVIASRLSIKPETLSRTFKRLVEQNYIVMREKYIVINDVVSFRALVMLG